MAKKKRRDVNKALRSALRAAYLRQGGFERYATRKCRDRRKENARRACRGKFKP